MVAKGFALHLVFTIQESPRHKNGMRHCEALGATVCYRVKKRSERMSLRSKMAALHKCTWESRLPREEASEDQNHKGDNARVKNDHLAG